MLFEEYLEKLSNPARSALEYAGIDHFEKLAALGEKGFLSLHGVGPKSLPITLACLQEVGLAFCIT